MRGTVQISIHHCCCCSVAASHERTLLRSTRSFSAKWSHDLPRVAPVLPRKRFLPNHTESAASWSPALSPFLPLSPSLGRLIVEGATAAVQQVSTGVRLDYGELLKVFMPRSLSQNKRDMYRRYAPDQERRLGAHQHPPEALRWRSCYCGAATSAAGCYLSLSLLPRVVLCSLKRSLASLFHGLYRRQNQSTTISHLASTISHLVSAPLLLARSLTSWQHVFCCSRTWGCCMHQPFFETNMYVYYAVRQAGKLLISLRHCACFELWSRGLAARYRTFVLHVGFCFLAHYYYTTQRQPPITYTSLHEASPPRLHHLFLLYPFSPQSPSNRQGHNAQSGSSHTGILIRSTNKLL